MSEIHLRTETLRGPALLPWLPALARLRIEVFREWPYLYEGDAAYEQRYLRSYAESPGAAVIVAFAGEEPVGAATCQPMAEASEAVRAVFAEPARWCYFGESVLRAAHRGRGLGHAFFDGREAHARQLGLSACAFCAVDRAPEDPRRPAGYRPLDGFWRKRGYTRQPQLSCSFDWKEIGAAGETPHRLTFWTREL